MLTTLLRPWLLFAALLAVPNAGVAQETRRWKDAELAPLAKGLGAYLDARAAGLGIDKAKTDLAASFEALRRASAGLDPLRQTLDLQRALALASDLSKVVVNKGKVSQDLFKDCSLDGAGLAYGYQLPKDYDPLKVYPLILAIPDENEAPAEHIRAQWISREVQEGAILVAVQMPKNQGEWARVTVNGRAGGLSYVLTGLRMASERFAVDTDRIYVVGRGKGVPVAIAAGNYSPHRFAAILGRAGDAGEIGPENFRNLPTWFAGGGARATKFQEEAHSREYDNCVLVPGGSEADLWAWIQKHPRQTNPKMVTVAPGDPFPTFAYWMRVAPIAVSARATATIERDTNTVRIRAEGLSQVTLYLNDTLVDLDKPMHIICNEVEGLVQARRHLQDTLDMLLDGTSDTGAVYVAQVIVPMIAESKGTETRAVPPKDVEFERAFGEAGAQVDKLWELSQWCKSTEREALGQRVLRRLLHVSPDHEGARAALGHKFAKGQWFTSQAALDRFLRSQDPVTAALKGQIEFKSLWMHPEERALVGKSWVKEQETGLWITPADRKRLTEGFARQDLEWIPPEETARMDEGLWKVDGEWVDLRVANERHARIDGMWRIPSADVLLYSTTDRETCNSALATMSRAMEDLRKVFGGEPLLPLRVAMLRDEEQYDRFAFGDPDGRRRATHAGRLHSVHSAYFAESWFPRVEGKPEFSGMGVCYWDPLVPGGNQYGLHAARLAVGLSYVEALDPSPKAVRQALPGGPKPEYYAAYQTEKLMPAWLRWGGAVYAERFFKDELVAADGDPFWARKWSLENLARGGALQPLSEVMAFKLDPENRDGSLRLLIEAGLVVSFIVDGNCAPVNAAHAQFKTAIAAGKLHPNDVKALSDALIAHEAELKAYAGL